MVTELTWSEASLRRLIASVPSAPAAYGPWWESPDGRRLAAAIHANLAGPVVSGVRNRTGRGIERAEVLGLVVEAFAPPSGLLRGLRSAVTERPIGYLVRSLVNALSRETGWELQEIPPDFASTGAQGTSRRLAAAILATTAALEPLTPSRLRPSLGRGIEQLVDRALDGALSRLHTRAAQDAELHRLGWGPTQIRALVNAVIGPRPDHARASLIAGFLAVPDWRPEESPAHRGALHSYARRMLRAESRAAADVRVMETA